MRRSSSTIWAATSGCLLGRAGRSVSSGVFPRRFLLLVICSVLSSLWCPPSSGGGSVRGRYSHVAAVMEGRVLLVAGGYSGVARGDLVAYKVPLFVSSDQGDRVSVKKVKTAGGGGSLMRTATGPSPACVLPTRTPFVPRPWMKACA